MWRKRPGRQRDRERNGKAQPGIYSFFPGADFCPGMKKVRLEKKQAPSELSKEQIKEN